MALFQFDFVNLFMACVSSRKYLLRRLYHLVIRSFVFLPLNSNNFVSIRHKHFSGCVVNKLFQAEIVFFYSFNTVSHGETVLILIEFNPWKLFLLGTMPQVPCLRTVCLKKPCEEFFVFTPSVLPFPI